MKRLLFVVAVLVAVGSSTALRRIARAAPPSADVTLLPDIALAGGDEGVVASSRLRHMGRAGLDLLMRHPRVMAARAGDAAARAEVEAVVDRVAAQKDALDSGLYWYHDLASAKREAQRTGRPILSLRLLGRLDEDLSCANSRFFRTVLYPNREVAQELSENFVLHWQSVRPVPIVTIALGDGRSIVTTVTGNSIHYVLARDGRPVDAIPGLVDSRTFLEDLRRGAALARDIAALPEGARDARLREWHARELRQLMEALERDGRALSPEARSVLEAARGRMEPGEPVIDRIIYSTGSFVSFPDGTKMSAEAGVMEQLVPRLPGIRGEIDDATWSALAKLHERDCEFDERSRALVERKERRAPGELEPLFLKLRHTVAEDTVRNRYMTGAQIHEWFAEGTAPESLDALNERVYREVFFSPTNDAWLGIVPPDVYTALDDGGKHGGA